MTWILDLLTRRAIRDMTDRLNRMWLNALYTQHAASQWSLAQHNATMPRAEYQRRCGYRFPLPAHLRRQP